MPRRIHKAEFVFTEINVRKMKTQRIRMTNGKQVDVSIVVEFAARIGGQRFNFTVCTRDHEGHTYWMLIHKESGIMVAPMKIDPNGADFKQRGIDTLRDVVTRYEVEKVRERIAQAEWL